MEFVGQLKRVSNKIVETKKYHMKNEKVFIPILLGTNRKDRNSENVAKWVFEKIKEREEIESRFFQRGI